MIKLILIILTILLLLNLLILGSSNNAIFLTIGSVLSNLWTLILQPVCIYILQFLLFCVNYVIENIEIIFPGIIAIIETLLNLLWYIIAYLPKLLMITLENYGLIMKLLDLYLYVSSAPNYIIDCVKMLLDYFLE